MLLFVLQKLPTGYWIRLQMPQRKIHILVYDKKSLLIDIPSIGSLTHSSLFHSFSILLMGSRERQEKTFYNPHEDRREYFQACLSATFSQKGPDRKHGIIQLWDFSILTEACTGTRGIRADLAFTHNLYANAELSRLFPPACPWAAHFGIIGSMLLLGCQNWIMMNRDQIILNCITTKPHISLKPRPTGQEDTVPPWVAPQN